MPVKKTAAHLAIPKAGLPCGPNLCTTRSAGTASVTGANSKPPVGGTDWIWGPERAFPTFFAVTWGNQTGRKNGAVAGSFQGPFKVNSLFAGASFYAAFMYAGRKKAGALGEFHLTVASGWREHALGWRLDILPNNGAPQGDRRNARGSEAPTHQARAAGIPFWRWAPRTKSCPANS